jgi:hypothetical protein
VRHRGNTENGHIGHWAHTSKGTNIKVSFHVCLYDECSEWTQALLVRTLAHPWIIIIVSWSIDWSWWFTTLDTRMPRHPSRRFFACGNTWKVRCPDEELHRAMALFRRMLDSANRVQFKWCEVRARFTDLPGCVLRLRVVLGTVSINPGIKTYESACSHLFVQRSSPPRRGARTFTWYFCGESHHY